MANEDLDKLDRVAKRKEGAAQNKRLETLEKVTSTPNPFTQFDIESKLQQLARREEEPGFISAVLQGVFWGSRHVWDRSYSPKFDFNLSQRSKIINYCYDRFTARAGKVSRRVSSFEFEPHAERLKSSSQKVRTADQDLQQYLEEIDAIREHNQFILTNELWNCHSRAKYGSMLWGMLLGASSNVLLFRRRSLPEKAFVFVALTYASMLYAKVAFTERVIDVYYPFFRQDVDKYCSAEARQQVEPLVTLGKSRPANKKMSAVEKELATKRLAELKSHKDLLMRRFDDVDQELPPKQPWRD